MTCLANKGGDLRTCRTGKSSQNNPACIYIYLSPLYALKMQARPPRLVIVGLGTRSSLD